MAPIQGHAPDAQPDTEPLLSSGSTSTTNLHQEQTKSTTPSHEHNVFNLPSEDPIPSTPTDLFPNPSHHQRTLSWPSAYIILISRMIGSGIFATPGSILSSVGSPGISLLLWLVGGLLSACGLAIALELGCMLPRSGGEKVYLEAAYPRPRFLASTLVAVQAVVLGFTASNCIVFGEYALFAVGAEPSPSKQRILGVGLLTAITILHGCLPRVGIWVQNMLGWVKISLMAFMALTGLAVVIFRPDAAEGVDVLSWSEIWKDSIWQWGTIATAVFKVSYSYAGYANINNVLSEVKDPVRTLKSVAPAALISVCGFYLLINVAYFIVVPVEKIKGSGELIAALFLSSVFGDVVGHKILPFMIAISAAGNVMVVTFALARLNQEIARQGFLPFPHLLASSQPFNAPLGGLIVHYIPSLLVITLPPPGDVYAFILDVEAYPGQFFSIAVSLGLLRLRRTRADLQRPFKAWLPAVWIRILMSLALIAAPFVRPKDGKGDVGFWYATYAVVGVSIILFGILYWYIWTILLPRRRGYSLQEQQDLLADGTAITRLVPVKARSQT